MNTQQQLRYLQVELAKAKAEAAHLRKKLQFSNRHAKRIDKAYEDALLLATWRSTGTTASRAFARKQGFTQNRWENAVALLKVARVIQRQRHWVMDDLGLIEARLVNAREHAMKMPGAFFSRHPRHHLLSFILHTS